MNDADSVDRPVLDNKVLLFGKLLVRPKAVLNGFLICYAAFFVLYRIADLIYLLDVDAKFPKGLEYLYPSERERLQSADYTRRSIKLSMMSKTFSFVKFNAGSFSRFEGRPWCCGRGLWHRQYQLIRIQT